MVYRIFTYGILTPNPWYIQPSNHGILNPLPMVCPTPYPWHFEHPTHGITNPLFMVYRTPSPWYIEPLIKGILTPNPDMSNPLTMAF